MPGKVCFLLLLHIYMYMYIYVHINIHIHTHTHIYIYTYTHTHTHIYYLSLSCKLVQHDLRKWIDSIISCSPYWILGPLGNIRYQSKCLDLG